MDLRTLTDEQLEQHRVDVLTEQERRQRLATGWRPDDEITRVMQWLKNRWLT